MFFQHVYEKGLAMGSYVIGCQATGEAMVIDPKRDIDTYLDIASKNKLQITHISETHIHADFLSGSRELAEVTGAKMYLSNEGGPDWQYEFEHVGVKDGDEIKVGNLSFTIMHTPGHTPESISLILRDKPASSEPVMIFTGDFVFVGDIGRPDLLEKAAGILGTKEEGAKQMFQSLKKFNTLPQFLQVWPAHGAGSACGKALGAVPSSTVGYELKRNWAFQFGSNENDFISTLLNNQPEPPKYFAMMKRLNKIPRKLLCEVPEVKQLGKDEFLTIYKQGITVLDTRSKFEFAKGFIPGSLNIPNNGAFSNWCGWMLKYDKPFIAIADPACINDIMRKLMRIGLDNLIGFVADINTPGLLLDQYTPLTIEAFEKAVNTKAAQIVDVRSFSEFTNGHIENATHVFLGTLEDNLDKISKDKDIIVHCQAGDRSSLAYSILRKNGFKHVMNFIGGMEEWKTAGNAVNM